MVRIRRTMISLAIVFVVYTVYVLALLPWIEPQYVAKAGDTSGDETQRLEPRQREWMSLFAEDAWERSELTKSLESDDGVLLFQKYSRDGKGRWTLTPATLIYYAAGGKEKKRRPFILKPKSAVLQFDGPLNLISGGRGKLVGGRLVGDLVISSPESAPGEGDDFQLKTRQVEIEAKRIWTPHEVAFRFGPHSGRGRNLTIRLQPQAGKSDGLSLGQMRSIELTQLDHLTILTEDSIIPSASKLPRPKGKTKAKVPVVVHCQGPFLFDVAESRASLQKNVELAREYAPSQNDYLSCQKLSIYFDSKRKQKESVGRRKGKRKKKLGGKSKLPSKWAVDRIVATGEPVQLLAPSASASFFGQWLEYHPSDKQIFLKDDSNPVRLQFGQHFCSAPQILYQTSDFNRLGTLRAIGPGVYRGSGKDLRVAITAKWQQELTLRPHQNNHVLSVHAGADVMLADANRIRAKQLHIWLKEVRRPPQPIANQLGRLEGNRHKLVSKSQKKKQKPKPKYDIRVERFLAIGGVALDSSQLTARTDQLEGWIRHDLAAPDGLTKGGTTGKARGDVKKTGNLFAIKDRKDKSKWDAEARLVRVQLAQSHSLKNSEIRLDSLILRDGVVLQEVATPKPEDEPVYLKGDWLRMTDGLTDNPQFIISANQGDAVVKARGLHLYGRRIDLQQGRNLMWIDGTGRMSAPVSADLNGNKLKKPMRMTVQWDRRMRFDGLTASFKDSVLVTGPQQVLRGKQLDVTLTKRVDFAKQMARAKSSADRPAIREKRARPEIRHLRFHGEVQAKSRSFDKQGKLESVDHMWIRDLQIHRDSGKIHGLGPGRMISRQRPSDSDRRRANLLTSRPKKADDKNKLNYLQVDFRSHLSGNLHERRITLFDDIQAIYGPIPNWNSQLHNRTPEGLGKRGVEIRSSQLTISEWKKKRGEKRGPLEVTAAGNTRVSGNTFAARAERLSYVEAKDLVVLESGGNDKAKIRHWSEAGGDTREVTGRKILFWPSRGEWKLENLGSFTLEGPGTFTPKLPKSVGAKK